METQVDLNATKAEMSAQSKLMENFPIDKGLVSDIDRHIKEIEFNLNENLIHIEAHHAISHYLPDNPMAQAATLINDDIWKSLDFIKTFPSRDCLHEEICYKRHSKGFAFFYVSGRVQYDVGVVEDFGGTDMYIRIHSDTRQEIKVTGAPVEVKIKSISKHEESP
jgi:hypothetical protein